MRVALLVALVGCDAPESQAPVADAGADLIVGVGEPVRLDGTGSEGARFRWSTGDGSIVDGLVVEHIFEEPGTYTATLEATAEDGTNRTDTLQVTAHLPLASTAPSRSAPMARTSEGLVVVNPEAGSLTWITTDGAARETGLCDTPRAVAVGATDVAVVCERGVGRMRVGEPPPLDTFVDFPTGWQGRAIAYDAQDDSYVFTVSSTGGVHRLTADGTVLDVAEVNDPGGLVVAPDGQILVSRFRSPDDVGLVHVIGDDPVELAYDPGPDSDTTNRGVSNLLGQLTLSPDGGWLYLPGVQANTARGLFRDGQPLTYDTTLRANLSVVERGVGEHFARRKVFDDQGRTQAVATSPLGDLVWVSHPGTGTVHAIDAWTGQIRNSILNAGAGVIALEAEQNVLYAYAWLDRIVTAYDLTTSPPRVLWSAATLSQEPLDDQVLHGKKLFWDALDPRIAKDGYLACAHCHPDGDQDGLVWDFSDRGEGVRNTISLLGRGGTAMGPLHWTANFDEVQDFENDMRHGFGGTGLLSEGDWQATRDPLGAKKAGRSAELDALAAYVTSLNQVPASPFRAGQSERGAALFHSEGCVACHPAPLYTDSPALKRHNVGTLTDASGERLAGPLDGLDTPTLLGAHATGPWLHDGSAATLQDAIRAHEGLAVNDGIIEDLAAWVRGL